MTILTISKDAFVLIFVRLCFPSYVGLGSTAPDPSATVSLDGIDVPLGNGMPSGVSNTSLLYNEYPLKSIFLMVGRWRDIG